ncbi:hypothetical protein KJ966_18295 [bacterium]|nr:hypothetical protein [bacterium]
MNEPEIKPLDPDAPAEKVEDSAPKKSTDLESALVFFREFDAFWKNQLAGIYEAKIELNNPLIVRINHLRQAIRFYLIPLIQNTQKNDTDVQNRTIKHLPVLFSSEKREKFFHHFYGVAKNEEKGWVFEKRDAFKVDELVLYDLYKVKRTMNGIAALLKELADITYNIPSIYSKERQIEILKGMNSAFFMTFKIAIHPKYQVELFRDISLNYIHQEQIEKRRKENLIYSRVKDLDFSPFRRVFFHILFRDQIKTTIKDRETVIKYSLVDLEQFIEEYFGYFLRDSAEQVEYMKTFHMFHIGGNTFTKSIVENPNPETLLFEEIDDIKTLI